MSGLSDADRERIALAAGWPDEGHEPLETSVEAIVQRAINEALENVAAEFDRRDLMRRTDNWRVAAEITRARRT